MRKEYDFSNSIKNPFVPQNRREVTVSIDENLYLSLENLADKKGLNVNSIITRCLDEYAHNLRKFNSK
jgi:hypothetical protein